MAIKVSFLWQLDKLSLLQSTGTSSSSHLSLRCSLSSSLDCLTSWTIQLIDQCSLFCLRRNCFGNCHSDLFTFLQIINLEKPYATNCTKRTLHMFNSHPYTAYTKAACLFKCRNEYTVKTCGCTPPEYKGMNQYG